MTCAVSVAKFTVAVTPGNSFKALSIDATQEEQVMPSIRSVSGSRALELFPIEKFHHLFMK